MWRLSSKPPRDVWDLPGYVTHFSECYEETTCPKQGVWKHGWFLRPFAFFRDGKFSEELYHCRQKAVLYWKTWKPLPLVSLIGRRNPLEREPSGSELSALRHFLQLFSFFEDTPKSVCWGSADVPQMLGRGIIAEQHGDLVIVGQHSFSQATISLVLSAPSTCSGCFLLRQSHSHSFKIYTLYKIWDKLGKI